MSGDLNALADRCEQATGADRELDCDIARAVQERPVVGSGMILDRFGFGSPVPAYSASLDAARSLVPEGWGWQLSHDGTVGMWSLESAPPKLVTMPQGQIVAFPDVAVSIGTKAATPALALCAAALRSRAQGDAA